MGVGQAEAPTTALTNLARRFVDASNAVDIAEEQLKKLKVVREIAEKKLADQMTTEQVKSFKTDQFGGFRQQVEVYPNVTDREVLNAYVKKRKSLEFLYTVSINGTKLRSFCRELMENSKPIPPGIDPFLKTVVRRYK